MKAAVLAACVLYASAVSAQTIHNGEKVGKLSYASPAEWPNIDDQGHWVPGNGSPAVDPPNTLTHDMAHTHVGIKAPIYAELNGPVSVTVPLKMFHTKGKMTLVWAFYAGPCGQQPIGIHLDKTLPLVGDPNGLVTMTGTMTIDPNAGLNVCVPKHGWFQVIVAARTDYDNHDRLDVQNVTPYFSMVDPTKPEPASGEATIPSLTSKTSAAAHNSTTVNVYGTQLVEFREMVPMFAPLTKPTTFHNFSYAYGFDHNLPKGSYELNLDPDLHMGLPGTALTFKASVNAAGSENFDLIDPVAAAISPAPTGYAPGVHKLLAAWVQPTGTAPIAAATGGMIAPNLLLKTLIAFDIKVDPSPTQVPVCTETAAANYGGPAPCEPIPLPGPMRFTALSPEDNFTLPIAQLKTTGVDLSVTAADDSGIRNCTWQWGATVGQPATRVGNSFSIHIVAPSTATPGTRPWSFTCTANDGEVATTPIMHVIGS